MSYCRLLLPLFILGTFTATLGAQAATQDQADNTVGEHVDQIQDRIDQNPDAQNMAESILGPIHQLGEQLSFPGFFWLAFCMMVAGVVGFALQLLLGKLFMLAKFHFSLTEILFDLMSLLISVIGLVLTTLAAERSSDFTHSPFMVISSAAVGVILGLIMFVWGTKQEARAAEAGRIQRGKNRSDHR